MGLFVEERAEAARALAELAAIGERTATVRSQIVTIHRALRFRWAAVEELIGAYDGARLASAGCVSPR